MNEQDRLLIRQFHMPSATYRGRPFWSWNGKLSGAELHRQARLMKQMGFGGYFMHSRVGLATEYLGDEWFALINALADEAQNLGMDAWLYDEDRWPSGSAGGLAAREVRYRMQGVRLTMPMTVSWNDDLLAAFVCRVDGLTFSRCRRLSPGEPARKRSGETILCFTRERMPDSDFYNGFAYIDTTNADATREFIRLTHEQYRQRCGRRLGTSIPGIFTDEPHRGSISSSHSGFKDPEQVMPWGENLAATFEKRFGYDLLERLPDVFLRREGQRISQVKWHYVECLQQLFLDNFMKPVYDWCQRQNVILTGHVLHEDSLLSEVIFNGSMMRNYEFMHWPGIDILTEGNRSYWAAKKLQSVARQQGKTRLLSELYGCTGWQFNFAGHKAVGDWQALFGINVRCHHLSWYTMQGEAKRDYPASILHQSAWAKEYRSVEDYFARLGFVLQQGEPACDLLVINPVESVWSQIHQGWADFLTPRSQDVAALEEKYRNLFHWLAGHQLDFDYADEDHLARFGEVTGRTLGVGKGRYRAVLVAGMETIRATTLDLLEKFVQQGGQVIVAGEPPAYVDALPSPRMLSSIPFSEDAVVSACRQALGAPQVEVLSGAGAVRGWLAQTPEGAKALTEVFCQVRRVGDALFVLALNTNRDSWKRNATIRIRGQGMVEEWNCRTGERSLVEFERRNETVEITTDFPPGGEKLYRLVAKAGTGLRRHLPLREIARQDVSGSFAYRLDEPNVCVLDFARWRMDEGAWQPCSEILQIDKAVRQKLNLPQRGGEMVQPWFAQQHRSATQSKAKLELEFEFFSKIVASVDLALESPEKFDVTINGRIGKPSRKRWVDICFKRKTMTVRKGRNLIKLTCGFHEGVDLESLFLLGNFGVQLNGTRRTLVALPNRLQAGSVTTQGLPFYGAGITYRVPLPVTGPRVFLELPGIEAACAVVGKQVIGWQPREVEVTGKRSVDVRVVLTRRNTFGPLHELPLQAAAYHPGSFRTTGNSWSNDYVLYPAGLLAPPVISIRQFSS
jgi:hypothetical protein